MSDPLSIIFSASALAISALSAVWSIAVHRLTGQYPKLSVGAMQIMSPGESASLDVISINISNYGRVPVTVTSWAIRFPPQQYMFSLNTDYLPPEERSICRKSPPETVLPGSSVSFFFPMKHICSAIKKDNNLDAKTAHVEVYFAAHKTLRSTETIKTLLEESRMAS